MRLHCLRDALTGLAVAVVLLAAAVPARAAVNHPFRGALVPASALEGPCGLAVDPGGDIYVSDYYHHSIGVWDHVTGGYGTHFASVGGTDGPCALAVDQDSNLYVNYWHGEVVRYPPFGSQVPTPVVAGSATGIAVDKAGNLYVDHRTSIDVYDAPVEPGESPTLQIGKGSLTDGFGLAVSRYAETEGLVYVADAADGLVKVYDPAGDPDVPVATLDGAGTAAGSFVSLTDASLAVDGTNGHLFVVDDLEPGFEHPHAAVDEFNSDGIYLGQIERVLIEGEPTGIAVNESFTPRRGELYVTSGNGSNVVLAGSDPNQASSLFAFGPASPSSLAQLAMAGAGSGAVTNDPAPASQEQARPLESRRPHPRGAGATATQSEVVQSGGVRVTFNGGLTPQTLPRSKPAPVKVSVSARIAPASSKKLPQLQRMTIAINRYGKLDGTGLPVCRMDQIQPATTSDALAACRRSLVGEGNFTAKVLLKGQAPFPSAGKVYAFNGSYKGKPAILAHVYGTQPAPTSYTLPFVISRTRGTFGTVLTASLPEVTADVGYVTGLSLNLDRSFSAGGRKHSYLSASCPAPRGFSSAPFSFARATFAFAGGHNLGSTLTRTCKAR